MERSSSSMSRAAWILGAAALGAAAMYVLDPEQGRRRRALAKDKFNSARLKTRKSVERKARDLSNRAHGAMAQARHMMPEKESSSSTQQPGSLES